MRARGCGCSRYCWALCWPRVLVMLLGALLGVVLGGLNQALALDFPWAWCFILGVLEGVFGGPVCSVH